MKKIIQDEIIQPKNQLYLYGYEDYFFNFEQFYQRKRLPNAMLLSGQKGLGKSTFVYHFVNYLLSSKEKFTYDRRNFCIDHNNSTYKLIQDLTHPNLFILDAINEENIKIEKIRELIIFLNKSTYYKNIKLVIIDNAEYLNINSANALLKSIEEPSKDTYFFLINNNSKKILSTIRSRCIEFNFNFSFNKKKNILNQLKKEYNFDFNDSDLESFLNFDTHGNFIRYSFLLKESKLKLSDDPLTCIDYFMDLYNSKNDLKILNLLTLLIQNFYTKLALNNGLLINQYYKNLNKILYMINNMKKFNLDKKNLIFSINKIIHNEHR